MKYIILFISFLIISCSVPFESKSDNDTKTVYVVSPTLEEFYTFYKVSDVVTSGSEILFEDWVYIGNNSEVWILLDLASVVGSNANDCIAVIRIESIEGVEGDGHDVTEWCNGEIRKPNPLLSPYEFSIYKDVRIWEGILWASSDGKLEVKFNFNWPIEKKQKIKVSFMQYAKTK